MAQRSKTRQPVYSADTLALRYLGGLLLAALGVMMFLAVEIRLAGNVFDALRQICFGLTGFLAPVLPVFPFWAGVLVIWSCQRKPPVRPFLYAVLAGLGLCALIVLVTRVGSEEYLAQLSRTSDGSWGGVIHQGYLMSVSSQKSGGALGVILGYPFWSLLGTIAGTAVLALLILLCVLLAVNLTPSRIRDLATGKASFSFGRRREDQSQQDQRQIAFQQEQERQRQMAYAQQQAYILQQQQQQQYAQQQYAQQRQQTFSQQPYPQQPSQQTRPQRAADWQQFSGGNSVADWQQQMTDRTAAMEAGRKSAIFDRNSRQETETSANTGRKSWIFDRKTAEEQATPAQGGWKSRIFGRKNQEDGLSDLSAEEKRMEGMAYPRSAAASQGRPGRSTTERIRAEQKQIEADLAQWRQPAAEKPAGNPAERNPSELSGEKPAPARTDQAVPETRTERGFDPEAEMEFEPKPEIHSEMGTARQPERNPEIYPEMGTARQAERIPESISGMGTARKSERIPETDPGMGTVRQSERIPEIHPETQPARQPERNPEIYPDMGTARQPEQVPEIHPEPKPERRPEPKPAAKAEQLRIPVAQETIADPTWKPELKHVTPKEQDPEEEYWEPTPYYAPPITDLKKPDAAVVDTSREDEERSLRLQETLQSFKVQARVVHVTHGPAISRFELELAPGTKVNKVAELEKDIAYGMQATSVRIEAPIPGKGLVGVEVPNPQRATVTLREVLESPQMQNAKSILTVALGKDIAGTPVVCDLARMPHLLIAGATGSGKSVCINTIINSLIFRAGPDDVKMILVDPKVVELQCYNGIPHLLLPVVNDPHKAAAALAWAVAEMMERYDKFSARGVRNLEGYNSVLREGEKPMPRIVIIIDELADLMMVCKKDVEEYICRLTQLARAAGIHLIVATQRPSVDVITGLIKANIPSRIAFKTASYVDSRTILDRNGSEQLLGWGDMLYLPTGSFAPTRVQGCFLSDEEVNRIADHVRQANPGSYDPDVLDKLEQLSRGQEDGEPGMDLIGGAPEAENADADLFEQAVEYAIADGQISTSTLQRRLKIGYARAGRLTDELEARGIISAKDGSKPRKCLITREQWESMKEETA